MSCYSPLVFQKCGINPETGKNKVVFHRHFSGNYEDYRNDKNIVLVPCGQCLGCRLDYAKTWAERCALEASCHQENMFLTLTYDNEHCPERVEKDAFKLFIKRLRNYFGVDKIRYFGCGEYGEKSHRPHYHIIVFGARFPDLKFFNTGLKPEDRLYTSAALQKLWPYGFSSVGDVTFESAGYTARYVLKKQKGVNKDDSFVLMSTRPGIGYNYLIENLDSIIKNQLIYFNFNSNKKTAVINKYFKKILKDYDFEISQELIDETIKRINAKFISDKQLYSVDKDLDLYDIKKNLKVERLKRLKRGLELEDAKIASYKWTDIDIRKAIEKDDPYNDYVESDNSDLLDFE